eukprot:14407603-Alexandrium_andersonii.AAC.1
MCIRDRTACLISAEVAKIPTMKFSARVEEGTDGEQASAYADSLATNHWASSWASTMSAHDTF